MSIGQKKVKSRVTKHYDKDINTYIANLKRSSAKNHHGIGHRAANDVAKRYGSKVKIVILNA